LFDEDVTDKVIQGVISDEAEKYTLLYMRYLKLSTALERTKKGFF